MDEEDFKNSILIAFILEMFIMLIVIMILSVLKLLYYAPKGNQSNSNYYTNTYKQNGCIRVDKAKWGWSFSKGFGYFHYTDYECYIPKE